MHLVLAVLANVGTFVYVCRLGPQVVCTDFARTTKPSWSSGRSGCLHRASAPTAALVPATCPVATARRMRRCPARRLAAAACLALCLTYPVAALNPRALRPQHRLLPRLTLLALATTRTAPMTRKAAAVTTAMAVVKIAMVVLMPRARLVPAPTQLLTATTTMTAMVMAMTPLETEAAATAAAAAAAAAVAVAVATATATMTRRVLTQVRTVEMASLRRPLLANPLLAALRTYPLAERPPPRLLRPQQLRLRVSAWLLSQPVPLLVQAQVPVLVQVRLPLRVPPLEQALALLRVQAQAQALAQALVVAAHRVAG